MRNESLYLPIVATAFARAGFPPELGCAIARQESNWDPRAAALTGGDGALGGSYGLCQMGLNTARGLGHKDITPEQLYDPAINASLAAELCADNLRRHPGATHEDLFALYNSGRVLAKAPHVTQTNYVPRCVKFMADYAPKCAGLKL